MLALPPAAVAEEFSVAELFFELNHTDGDLGLHGRIDGDEWKRLAIRDEQGRKLLDAHVLGRLKLQGLTELAFESAEPGFDELPPEDFFARFPAGSYRIEGTTLDGEAMQSLTSLSHVLPAPVGGITISGLAAAESCDADPLPAVAAPVILDWDEVTASHPDLGEDGPLAVASYEVVVADEAAGLSLNTQLPPSITALTLPTAFTALAEVFKLEILVRASNGNRTAVETCFTVE